MIREFLFEEFNNNLKIFGYINFHCNDKWQRY